MPLKRQFYPKPKIAPGHGSDVTNDRCCRPDLLIGCIAQLHKCLSAIQRLRQATQIPSGAQIKARIGINCQLPCPDIVLLGCMGDIKANIPPAPIGRYTTGQFRRKDVIFKENA